MGAGYCRGPEQLKCPILESNTIARCCRCRMHLPPPPNNDGQKESPPESERQGHTQFVSDGGIHTIAIKRNKPVPANSRASHNETDVTAPLSHLLRCSILTSGRSLRCPHRNKLRHNGAGAPHLSSLTQGYGHTSPLWLSWQAQAQRKEPSKQSCSDSPALPGGAMVSICFQAGSGWDSMSGTTACRRRVGSVTLVLVGGIGGRSPSRSRPASWATSPGGSPPP